MEGTPRAGPEPWESLVPALSVLTIWKGQGQALPAQGGDSTSHPRGVLGSCYLVRWGEPGGAMPALPEPGAQCTDSHFFINS